MWFAIFKSGSQTDSTGKTKTWTNDDLDTIVSKYNQQPEGTEHRAPIVIGHPVDNSPAYGWIEELKREGDLLYAKAKDVTAEFVSWFKKGLYRERSISVFDDLTLEHVGFLGAIPPAVLGMPEVPANAFSGGSKGNRYSMQFSETVVEGEAANIGTPAASSPTIEEATAAQLERSKQFSIRPCEKGNVVKPNYYSALTDAEYGDPVNYLFPCGTMFQTLASLRNYSNGYGYDYTETEKQIIMERIFERSQLLGLPLPMDRLVNYYSAKFSHYTQGGSAMLDQFIEWLTGAYPGTDTADQTKAKIGELQNQMLTDLLAWIESTFGAEVKIAAEAKITELQTAPQAPAEGGAAAGGTAPAEGAPAAHSGKKDATQIRLDAIELERRTEKFEAFAKGLGFGGVQLSAALTQLENAHKLEASGVAGAVDAAKKFMEASKPAVDLNKFASRSGGKTATVSVPEGSNPERAAMHVQISNYASQHKITYTEAFTILKKEGSL